MGDGETKVNCGSQNFQEFKVVLRSKNLRATGLERIRGGNTPSESLQIKFLPDYYTWKTQEFPGGSVVKIPCSQYRGSGFSPGSGN